MKLYRVIENEYLNGIHICPRRMVHYRLHYGELPVAKAEIIKNYDYVTEHSYRFSILADTTIFSHRQFLRATPYLDHKSIKIFREDFKEFKITYTPVEEKDCTMATLLKELSTEDFIKYCKDNTLNICPLD